MVHSGLWFISLYLLYLLFLYIENIWISLSLIYIFESGEFIFSEIPGSEYWAESSRVDTLVSDILMGLLGFWTVSVFNRGIRDSYSWYAYLQPITTSPQWYRKWAWCLHVILAGVSAVIITPGYIPSGIASPILYQFALLKIPHNYTNYDVLHCIRHILCDCNSKINI
jgi:hypothetical protein